MAHTVTVRKLVEGSKDVIYKVYLKSDGASAELNGYVISDPATWVPPKKNDNAVPTIVEFWYELPNFQVSLFFGGTTPLHAWTLGGGSDNHVCFDKFGGIPKDQTDLNSNGKIQINTGNFKNAIEGSFVIKIRKD